MPEYRFYPLDAENRFIGPARLENHEDDASAARRARELVVKCAGIEVWMEARRVATVWALSGYPSAAGASAAFSG